MFSSRVACVLTVEEKKVADGRAISFDAVQQLVISQFQFRVWSNLKRKYARNNSENIEIVNWHRKKIFPIFLGIPTFLDFVPSVRFPLLNVCFTGRRINLLASSYLYIWPFLAVPNCSTCTLFGTACHFPHSKNSVTSPAYFTQFSVIIYSPRPCLNMSCFSL